jgi:hypothetical protein
MQEDSRVSATGYADDASEVEILGESTFLGGRGRLEHSSVPTILRRGSEETPGKTKSEALQNYINVTP